jgi:hypothetical protein
VGDADRSRRGDDGAHGRERHEGSRAVAEIGDDDQVDINEATGLPKWVNHVAFDAPTREALDHHRERWTERRRRRR